MTVIDDIGKTDLLSVILKFQTGNYCSVDQIQHFTMYVCMYVLVHLYNAVLFKNLAVVVRTIM